MDCAFCQIVARTAEASIVHDDDRLLVGGVHLPPHLQLLQRVEAVEGRRTLGVGHLHEPFGPVGPAGAGDDPARLVRVVPPGMLDHRVDQVAADRQHDRHGTCRPPRLTPAAPRVTSPV